MRRIAVHTFALFVSLLILFIAIAGLTRHTFNLVLPDLLPFGGGFALGLDLLSSFFLLIIATSAIPAAFYAIGYTKQYTGRDLSLGLAFNIFIVSMAVVVLARNVLTFLFFWEVMSLASYFLVMTDGDREDTYAAGWLYAVMTHAGLACLLIGFLAMSQYTGTLVMADWSRAATALPASARSAVFVILAVGFLSKAGAVPFHIWLPRAHPAAPSHVSALMSGVMIKLGVYGLIRIGFDWLGAGPAWWGVLILILGGISALLGVLDAIIESDLKRVLAYSSVENIGVILLGAGAGLLFRNYNLQPLAALALTGALLHCLNHAIFKSLLFLGAGAVVHATGTGNMEEMGGLLRRMPQTGALFLVGSLAISAMPPFNGFVSEWLTFQSLLLSFQIPERLFNLVFALSIAALALTAGLAAACFVRAFGITFLALPRSPRVDHAHEAHWTMRISMALLAAAVFVLGIGPSLALRPLAAVTGEFIGQPADLTFSFKNISAAGVFSAIAPGPLAVLLGALMLSMWVGLRIGGANFRRRYYETWGCGRAVQTARFEYTALAFANPFKRVFASFYKPVAQTEVQSHTESRFFVKTITYRQESRSIIEDSIYAPLGATVRRISARARSIQSGNVHSYLLYMLLALIVVLLVAK